MSCHSLVGVYGEEVKKRAEQVPTESANRSPNRGERLPASMRQGRSGTDGLFAFARPFGSQAATGCDNSRRPNSFASSSFDEFALSRMKGVLDPGRTQEACPRKIHKNWTSGLLLKSRIFQWQSQIPWRPAIGHFLQISRLSCSWHCISTP